MKLVPFSTEFTLVALCCCHGRSDRDRLIDDLLQHPVDSERVAAIAQRHRVEALVAQTIAAMGAGNSLQTMSQLARRAQQAAANSLGVAHAACKLGSRLDVAGIDWISVKGPALSQLAYGSSAIKASRDFDILVSPADFDAVTALLQSTGFRRVVPGPEVADSQLAIWMHHYKDCGWLNSENGMLVEVHCRLFANQRLMPDVGLTSPRQRIVLPGIGSLPTLDVSPLYAYLVAHGSVSGWSRLKWLADIAALLRPMGIGRIAQLHRDATSYGVQRSSAQALLLAERLLGLQLPDGMAEMLRRQPTVRLLERVALAQICGRNETEEVDWSGFATLPSQASLLLLGGNWRYVSAEVAQKLRNPVDRAREALPPWLSGLYPILAAWRYFGRRLMRGGAGR